MAKGGVSMTNTLEFEIAIKRAGLTKREIAKRLGLSEQGLYKKINNETEFKASEIDKLAKMLSISNVDEIFFHQNSDLKSSNKEGK
jgi:transcriptional regulator with XRE-family HTH domain